MASVTVWNGYVQERADEEVAVVYPDDIHAVLTEALESRGHDMRVATFDEPGRGLTEAVLDDIDALIWWGHKTHEAIEDAVVKRVCEHVYGGMEFVPLHFAYFSKVFRRLMGTPCSLRYRESDERKRAWVVNPGHPIADGLDESFVVPETEMYDEPFTVSESDRLVFASQLEGGKVFRSDCYYRRGSGRIFYFRPDHEIYPVYGAPVVREVFDNAVRQTTANGDEAVPTADHAVDPVE